MNLEYLCTALDVSLQDFFSYIGSEIRGFELAGLLLDLENALGVSVDLVPTGSLDDRFLKSIKDEKVLLYEAS